MPRLSRSRAILDPGATTQSRVDPSASEGDHAKDVGYRAAPGTADLAAGRNGEGGLPPHARLWRVGAVLVTGDDRRLVGIFTGWDAVHRVLAEGRSAARTALSEVMTRNPTTMPPGKTAIEALRLMEDGRYRHVPMVDDGKVVGIVSRFDFSGLEVDRLDGETVLWERIRPLHRGFSRRPHARPTRSSTHLFREHLIRFVPWLPL